ASATPTTPVPPPNALPDPGEGALIHLPIMALHNGINAIGQTTTFVPPPPPGSGTIRAVGSFNYVLAGDNGASTAAGSWSNRSISAILSAGSFTGNPSSNGAALNSVGGAQFFSPGQTADATNPISDAFRGAWTPSSYLPRMVVFRASGESTGVPPVQSSSFIVQYGSAFVDPNDPTTEYALYL